MTNPITALWNGARKRYADLQFNHAMATWSAAVAASFFALGGATEQALARREAEARALGRAGQSAQAIQELADAHREARGTLHAAVREGQADANRRLAEQLERANEAAAEGWTDTEETNDRVQAVTARWAEQRQALHESYLRTLRRERLQLEAMSEDWDAEGRARARARIRQLRALEAETDEALLGAKTPDRVDDALALDAAAPAEPGVTDQLTGAVQRLQRLGLVKGQELREDAAAAAETSREALDQLGTVLRERVLEPVSAAAQSGDQAGGRTGPQVDLPLGE